MKFGMGKFGMGKFGIWQIQSTSNLTEPILIAEEYRLLAFV